MQRREVGYSHHHATIMLEDARTLREYPKHLLGVLNNLVRNNQIECVISIWIHRTLEIDIDDVNFPSRGIIGILRIRFDAEQMNRLPRQRIFHVEEIISVAATEIENGKGSIGMMECFSCPPSDNIAAIIERLGPFLEAAKE